MTNIICKWKGCINVGEHEHHLRCRFMDNPKGLGKKIALCKKHHDMIHFIIPSLYWKELNQYQKINAIKRIEDFVYKNLKGEQNGNTTTT